MEPSSGLTTAGDILPLCLSVSIFRLRFSTSSGDFGLLTKDKGSEELCSSLTDLAGDGDLVTDSGLAAGDLARTEWAGVVLVIDTPDDKEETAEEDDEVEEGLVTSEMGSVVCLVGGSLSCGRWLDT